VKQGFQSREVWAVSLSKTNSPVTSLVTVVQIDGRTGEVIRVNRGNDRRVKC